MIISKSPLRHGSFTSTALGLVAMLLSQVGTEAAVPCSDISPDCIRGVKWTPKDEAKGGVVEFDTAGLTMTEFLDELNAKGINSIVLKIVDIDNQIPDSVGTDAQKKKKRNAAIATALNGIKCHSKSWHVFLWKRNWFEKKGRPASGNEFISELSEIINTAKSDGYDDILEGIMPIENNIASSASVLKYAVEAAHGINGQTKNWLKSKTFLFPGAGMGAYFRGIDTAWTNVTLSKDITKETNFFENMKKETCRFIFVLKNMPSQPADVCALDKYSQTFIENGVSKKGWEELGSTATAGYATEAEAETARYTFQNETMGFRDLKNFLTTNAATYPSQTGVIYWGDANEGMTANERSEFFHQTFHKLMTEENGYKGHFTYYPVLNETATIVSSFNLRKYLFQVKTVKCKQTIQPRGTGWQNWQGWVKKKYTIVPTTSEN